MLLGNPFTPAKIVQLIEDDVFWRKKPCLQADLIGANSSPSSSSSGSASILAANFPHSGQRFDPSLSSLSKGFPQFPHS